MYLESKNKIECYGCMACVDVCPVKAIEITTSNDTFMYPHINEDKCINCNLCKKICSYENKTLEFHEPRSAIVGVCKNNDDYKKSSSGGAFKSIIRAIVSKYRDCFKKIYVAGVIFNSNLKCVYDIVELNEIDDVDVFSKSKYVFCEPIDTYRRIHDLIKDKNNLVVFSGTPCQCGAMLSYLKEKKDNIIFIDLICKGAPSQYLFDKYLCEIEENTLSNIVEYNFKNKDTLANGTVYSRSSKYVTSNGKAIYATRLNDPFLKIFYEKNYISRASCNQCLYHNRKRISDITIGDAWGIEKIHPDLNPIKGVSVVLFNSEKGYELKKFIESFMFCYECSYNFIVENNSALSQTKTLPIETVSKVQEFYKNIFNNDLAFSKCVEMYFDSFN